MPQSMAAWLVAAGVVATCIGSRSFVLPGARQRTGSSVHLSTGRSHAPLRAASVVGGAQFAQASSHYASALFVGSLMAGAAALSRRSERRRLARFVTMEDIEALTIDDVPARWRPSVSIGLARRNAIVEGIAEQLDKTFFVMAFNRDAMLGREVEEARALFPESVNVRCLKNSLVRKAMEGTEWEPLAPKLKGSNMYVFVESDRDLKDTIKAYLKIEKKFDRVAALEKHSTGGSSMSFVLKPLVGGMMAEEWNVIEPEDLPKFKDFPTKTELIGQIAFSIKQVTTKLAKGVKQVPQKLAIGIKKTAEKGEEDGKSTIGEVAV
eukprot:gb/GFBE01018271.1/.p1 GENE.gb/GFBE01018271.1/~~gb/GFBE01018271.1/.p1  ORF type:complete len:322 (+),score=92.86 gb/GFBE01018271.1/:1-966(+)